MYFFKNFLLFLFLVLSWSGKSQKLEHDFSARSFLLEDSFSFVYLLGSSEEKEAWISSVKSFFPESLKLVKKVFELHLWNNNRKQMWNDYLFFLEHQNCLLKSKDSRDYCEGMAKSMRNLMDLPFQSDTPIEKERVKELLEQGSCEEAVVLLGQIQNREGSMISLMNALEQAYSCLNNEVKILELKKMRNIYREKLLLD